MSLNGFDLARSAYEEMVHEGFDPDFSPEVKAQVAALRSDSPAKNGDGVRDLRNLLWSSIDNATSRDLDQIEVAERVGGGIRFWLESPTRMSMFPRDRLSIGMPHRKP